MQWFLKRGDALEGPFTEKEIHAWLSTAQLPEGTLVGPARDQLHPVQLWRAFSPHGHLDPSPTGGSGNADGFEGRGTQVLVTDSSAQEAPVSRRKVSGEGTQIMGGVVDEVSTGTGATVAMGSQWPSAGAPEPAEPLGVEADPWPGAEQLEPHVVQAGPSERQHSPPRHAAPGPTPSPIPSPSPAPPLQASPRVQSGSPPGNNPSVHPSSHPRAAADRGLFIPEVSPRQEPLTSASNMPRRSPSPAKAEHRAIGRVPAPQLPPVGSSWGLGQILTAAMAGILLAGGIAFGADRALQGPNGSAATESLPAGSDWYVEIPSLRRVARGAQETQFIDWEQIDGAPFDKLKAELTQGKNSELGIDVLESLVSFAACEAAGGVLLAFEHDDDSAMNALVQSGELQDAQETPRGLRFTLKKGNTECLWRADALVTVCGGKAAMDTVAAVVNRTTQPATTDTNLRSAKRRPWSSYLPFAERPVLYAVANAHLFKALPFALPGFSGASLQGYLNENGFIERLDAFFIGPELLSEGAPLTLAGDLPEGILMYANYRMKWPTTDAELEKLIKHLDSDAAPGDSPSLNGLLGRLERQLGTSVVELGNMLGLESLFAVSVDPEIQLREKKNLEENLALLLIQEVKDTAKFRKMLKEGSSNLPAEMNARWEDESTLVVDLPEGAQGRLTLGDQHLRLIAGTQKEIDRIQASRATLSEDSAHDRSRRLVEKDSSVVLWMDGGRLMKMRTFEEEDDFNQPAAQLQKALLSSGPNRLTMAAGLELLPGGSTRLRTANMPVGLLLLTTLYARHLVAGKAASDAAAN